MFATIRREWHKRKAGIYIPDLGERHTLCNWIREPEGPLFDMVQYAKLLEILPDHIVTSLERARDDRAGRGQMLRAGLGYEEMLSSAIVDGTAIASTATENILFPNLLLPANYLQPGGIPGRTLRSQARGRCTNIASTGTLTFKIGSATTNATVPGVIWAQSGAIVVEGTTVMTNVMWEIEAHTVVRSIGSAGTVMCMGDSDTAIKRFTSAVSTDQQNLWMSSAGAATPATVAVDMTVPQYKLVTAKWSLATAYSIQGHQYIVEALN